MIKFILNLIANALEKDIPKRSIDSLVYFKFKNYISSREYILSKYYN